MRKMFLVLLGLLAMGECSDVQAGRRHRRACPPCHVCAPQPACCQPAPSYAATGETHFREGIRTETECVCAVYSMTDYGGSYDYYYAIGCSTGQPQGLSGNFTPTNPVCPMTGCPPDSCITVTRFIRKGDKPHGHKPGTKLPNKLKHDDVLPIKNDGKFTTTEISNTKTIVRFKAPLAVGGTVTIFAKLHIIQVAELVTVGNPPVIRGQFAIGQQIKGLGEQGAGMYDFFSVEDPGAVVIPDPKNSPNVAHVTLGGITYQVVTKDNFN